MSTTKTETTTPKTETASNPFAGFDPMTAWTTMQQTMQQTMAEAVARMTAFSTEYAALEAQMHAKAQGAIANWAQLANEALAYSAQLSAQARKLGLETARKFGAGA
jgi:hypothetical protein